MVCLHHTPWERRVHVGFLFTTAGHNKTPIQGSSNDEYNMVPLFLLLLLSLLLLLLLPPNISSVHGVQHSHWTLRSDVICRVLVWFSWRTLGLWGNRWIYRYSISRVQILIPLCPSGSALQEVIYEEGKWNEGEHEELAVFDFPGDLTSDKAFPPSPCTPILVVLNRQSDIARRLSQITVSLNDALLLCETQMSKITVVGYHPVLVQISRDDEETRRGWSALEPRRHTHLHSELVITQQKDTCPLRAGDNPAERHISTQSLW